MGLTVRFLDTLYFSGFCDDSKDLNIVATVHANYCRSISAKLADLTIVLYDWRRFKIMPIANQTSTFGWTQHVNCRDSWKKLMGNLGLINLESIIVILIQSFW